MTIDTTGWTRMGGFTVPPDGYPVGIDFLRLALEEAERDAGQTYGELRVCSYLQMFLARVDRGEATVIDDATAHTISAPRQGDTLLARVSREIHDAAVDARADTTHIDVVARAARAVHV